MVCHAAHSHAISHDLQLFLDVLRGRSSSLSACCGFYQGACCDENFLRHWLDSSTCLRHNLQHFEVKGSRRRQIVSESFPTNNCHFKAFSIFVGVGSKKVIMT